MSRRRAVRYVAFPLHADGREMLGTHGNVTTASGQSVPAEIMWGEYVSAANMVRFCVSRYGRVGITYAICRWPRGGYEPRRELTYTRTY